MPIKHSLPFITGMGYRKLCNYVYDEFTKMDIDKVKQFKGMRIFVKTDLLPEFVANVLGKITVGFELYTHNSDFGIKEVHLYILENPWLICWYAQNIWFKHKKLKSIPIGIANSRWPHGNVETLKKIMREKNEKNMLLYCNFDVNTNPLERSDCLNKIWPYKNDTKKSFEEYLRLVSKSYFVISPNGNGIDCHKHWEAMYLKAIPIVTKSFNIEQYPNYPFLIIDSWDDFKKLKLTKELYDSIINDKIYNLYL